MAGGRILSVTNRSEYYAILDIARIKNHLVVKVKYQYNDNCDFDGINIMVFLDVSEFAALRWKKIDPRFRDNNNINYDVTSAPSPAARFPGTDEGWEDAIEYAKNKL